MRALGRIDAAPETLALALAESGALGRGDELLAGIYDWDPERLDAARRAAFVSASGRVLAEGPPGGPLAPPCPEARQVFVPRGPWRRHGNPLDLIGQLGWPARSGGRGDPHWLYAGPERWLLVEQAPGPRGWQAPELRHTTSTSLPARLARASLNLVARSGDLVLDPLCGAGVILVEAFRLGCRLRGGDLSPKACFYTRENLRGVGWDGPLDEVAPADALRPGQEDGPPGERPAALVTDLPYGIRLAETPLEPLLAALPQQAERWAIWAHRDLTAELATVGHSPREVIQVPKPTFSRYLHLGGSAL